MHDWLITSTKVIYPWLLTRLELAFKVNPTRYTHPWLSWDLKPALFVKNPVVYPLGQQVGHCNIWMLFPNSLKIISTIFSPLYCSHFPEILGLKRVVHVIRRIFPTIIQCIIVYQLPVQNICEVFSPCGKSTYCYDIYFNLCRNIRN